MRENIKTLEDAYDRYRRLGAVVKYYNGKLLKANKELNKTSSFSLCRCFDLIGKINKYEKDIENIEYNLRLIKDNMEKSLYPKECDLNV